VKDIGVEEPCNAGRIMIRTGPLRKMLRLGEMTSTSEQSRLDKEVESWKGFPWALRKDDLGLWNAVVEEVRDDFGKAMEKSGKTFTTDPIFIALLLAQQRTGKYLGKRVMYLEAGSGASDSIPPQTVKAVRKHFGIHMVGGGITSPDKAHRISAAGADIIVVGNLLQTQGFERTLRAITSATRR
jgi:hypothetical protein